MRGEPLRVPRQRARRAAVVGIDGDGFEVLARNALGETRYRYYRPGSYGVVLQAFDEEKYADLSNRVSITC